MRRCRPWQRDANGDTRARRHDPRHRSASGPCRNRRLSESPIASLGLGLCARRQRLSPHPHKVHASAPLAPTVRACAHGILAPGTAPHPLEMTGGSNCKAMQALAKRNHLSPRNDLTSWRGRWLITPHRRMGSTPKPWGTVVEGSHGGCTTCRTKHLFAQSLH